MHVFARLSHSDVAGAQTASIRIRRRLLSLLRAPKRALSCFLWNASCPSRRRLC